MAIPSPISFEELLEIHAQVRAQAEADPTFHYEDREKRGPSVARLEAIVDSIPVIGAREQAAWLLRAIVLVQPFPDGNHRTGLLAAELRLDRAGIRFRPVPDAAALFQQEVSSRRYKLLGGYEDAPLALLKNWHDPVMECCLEFIRTGASTEAL